VQCPQKSLRQVETMVGLEAQGTKYMSLYIPRGDGLHEGWIEPSQRETKGVVFVGPVQLSMSSM
jgi:hypothetical protein